MRPWGALAAALLLAACLPEPAPQLPPAPVPVGAAIRVEARPVAEMQDGSFTNCLSSIRRSDGRDTATCPFVYAGGLHLTSPDTSRLHGFSDLKVEADGRLLAIGDQADLLEARIVLDSVGRLSGLSEARLLALKETTGVDLYAGGQKEYDSEGIARLPTGETVVSFEQHDRILVYGDLAGVPRPAPMPDIRFTDNKGMEALVAAPEVAPDAYRVGLENSGQLFLCQLSKGCRPDGRADPEGSELVAMENLSGGRRAYLFRSFSPLRGNVVVLRVVDRSGRVLDQLKIERPMTVDNFEGLAAAPMPGGVRFYLISDDNFGTYDGKPTDQKTLLLAFDWRPAK